MRRSSASEIVLKVLGLLLLTAAVLKGHELLTVPVANKDLWSWRPFLIFQVEFELALGIWLLSGLFKRLAWLAALTCFSLFCCVTLYKGLTGAASCGCFGRIHVNPWITLAAMDLPAVVALSLFHPVFPFGPLLSLLRRIVILGRSSSGWNTGQESIRSIIRNSLKPLAISFRLIATAGFTLAVLSTTVPVLVLNKPALATSTYEVLEPKTWVGKELPILAYIDIGERLRKGTWLLLFYHHDCPDCQKAIPQYERMASDLAGNRAFLHVGLVEVPPYGPMAFWGNQGCALGRLADTKEWFVTTPTIVLLSLGEVRAVWEGEIPDPDTILAEVNDCGREAAESPDLHVYMDRERSAL
jgi:thiol-disulfide isomerase/thioredoxin